METLEIFNIAYISATEPYQSWISHQRGGKRAGLWKPRAPSSRRPGRALAGVSKGHPYHRWASYTNYCAVTGRID